MYSLVIDMTSQTIAELPSHIFNTGASEMMVFCFAEQFGLQCEF